MPAGPGRLGTVAVVERRIVGFHRDDEGDWVAHLDCGHRQHVRHRPPFQERPWVLSAGGRESRTGTPIECPLCDRGEPPVDDPVAGVVPGPARPGPVDPDEGGEAACYAHLLCEDCGVVLEPGGRHRDGCASAG